MEIYDDLLGQEREEEAEEDLSVVSEVERKDAEKI